MAILFDDAATEYIEVDSTPITAAAFTMGCWFNSDSNSAVQTLMSIQDKDNLTNVWRMVLRGDVGGDPLQMQVIATTPTAASTTLGYTINTWHHACMVVAAANDRTVYLDGANSAQDTNTRAPAGADRLSIGRLGNSSPEQYMSGRIAEAAVWSVALTSGEVALLAQGFSPLLVRPEALVFYLPMIALGGGGTQMDWVGGRTLTEVNTPATGAHPPMFYPPQFSNMYDGALSTSALAATIRYTSLFTALPLSATYRIFSSPVPRTTFITNDED